MLRTIVKVVAVLIFLSGLVWFLQGINILPGSIMTGQIKWAINGSIAMLIGGALFWFSNRKR